jgi:hypothetical protein
MTIPLYLTQLYLSGLELPTPTPAFVIGCMVVVVMDVGAWARLRLGVILVGGGSNGCWRDPCGFGRGG